MEARIRACHVIHSLGLGGAEHVLVDLADVADDAGLDLSVLSLMPVGGRHFAKVLEQRGIPVKSLNLRSRWDIRAASRAVNAIGPWKPDLIHTHLKHADLVGSVVADKLHVPMVSSLHLVEDNVGLMGQGKRWLAAHARSRRAARIIAVSDALRQWYCAIAPADASRVVTIHNGISPPPSISHEERLRLRTQLGVSRESVMVTMVGVLRVGKGHFTLLDAVTSLPGGSRMQFVVAGDGPLRGRIEEAAARVPTGTVILAGFRRDVPQLLAASDIVVQPSDFDALPTSLLHALAAGRPAVATNVGGIPEIITPGTGLLVPPRHPESLARALHSLAEDPATRLSMGTAARLRFNEEYEAHRWAQRLHDLYEDVMV